jgi:hypothetical protein
MNDGLYFNGKGFFPPRDGKKDPTAVRVQLSREGLKALAIKLTWLMMMETNPVDDCAMDRQVTNILHMIEEVLRHSGNLDISEVGMGPPDISLPY